LGLGAAALIQAQVPAPATQKGTNVVLGRLEVFGTRNGVVIWTPSARAWARAAAGGGLQYLLIVSLFTC
jgi:hypothetical protein